MIHLPKTADTRRKARVQDPDAEAREIGAAVREPLPIPLPLPAGAPRVHVAGPIAGVTPRGASSGFFRDPQAFRALGEVVPSLFQGKGPDGAVRVWVAGCATGEEAWSIAILLAEHAATLAHPPACQLFATDTFAAGCARGRDALYLASTVAGVPTERLRRFFIVGGRRIPGRPAAARSGAVRRARRAARPAVRGAGPGRLPRPAGPHAGRGAGAGAGDVSPGAPPRRRALSRS